MSKGAAFLKRNRGVMLDGMTVKDLDTLLSMPELRRHVPFTPARIERAVRRGEFPAPIVVAGRKVWRVSEVAQYIADQQPEIAADHS